MGVIPGPSLGVCGWGLWHTITITTITGGHRVTITDADHPSGQSFDIMDGTGAGDMLSSTYDPNDAVATAGGIPAYVTGRLPVVLNQTTYSDSGGNRTFAFSNAVITTTSVFDFYCDVFGVSPTSVSVSAGSLSVVFKVADGVTECQVEVK